VAIDFILLRAAYEDDCSWQRAIDHDWKGCSRRTPRERMAGVLSIPIVGPYRSRLRAHSGLLLFHFFQPACHAKGLQDFG
jgi:hypothetical protein